jgi:hypothetical protein
MMESVFTSVSVKYGAHICTCTEHTSSALSGNISNHLEDCLEDSSLKLNLRENLKYNIYEEYKS